MNKTVKVLARICNEYRLQEKLLFVPSYAIGHQIGEYLAKTGTSWINLRATTVAGHAQELAGSWLSAAGIRLIDPHERLLIIEKLFREEPAAYFREAEEMPGVLRCFGKAVYELRMAGLTGAMVDPEDFIVRDKGADIACLLNAYERFLKENKLIDPPGLLGVAIEKLKKARKVSEKRMVMVLSDFPFSLLERDLISTVGGENLIVVNHNRPVGPAAPERFFEVNEAEPGKPEADIDLLVWLLAPEKASKAHKDGTVSLFHALGESNEVREVLRRVLYNGIPFDDVLILLTSTDPYIPIIHEITTAQDIPTTFAEGIPVTYTRPGKALLLYLEWLSEDFGAVYFRRLLSGGYLDLNAVEAEGERPSPNRAGIMVREAAVGWGRGRYEKRLKALADGYSCGAEENRKQGDAERAERLQRFARQAEWLVRFTKQVLATMPDVDEDDRVTIQAVCRGALIFLNRFCRIAGDMDRAAKSRLAGLLDVLQQAPRLTHTVTDAAGRLAGMIREISVGFAGPKPGHVHVAHYSGGGYSGRANTFILGLDQVRFPGTLLQDPVILDQERERAGSGLTASTDRLHEKIYIMAKTLGSLTGKVTLSYCCRDLREDRALFPASLLLGVYRLMSGDLEGDYRALTRFLGDPVGFIPAQNAQPINGWEWWFTQRSMLFGRECVFACHPRLRDGHRAETERGGDALGEYDGWVPSFAGSVDPLGAGAVFSATRLECLARCPYAYFLQHVLRIEPLKELIKDAGRWLDAGQRGSLIHDVFCRFMEMLKARDEKPCMAEHFELIKSIALEEVEKWKPAIPPASAFAFERELTDILLTVRIFLEDEERHCRRVDPCFFELSFGIGGEESGCGISEEAPVEIKIPGQGKLRLRGRIDRIDQSGAHEYEVWDYKTGSPWGYKDEGFTNQGRHLQHALYALAAESLLGRKLDKKARVVRAGYFFPGPRGEGRRIGKSQRKRKDLYPVLEDLFELLEKGVFPPSCDAEPCGICDYETICGGPRTAVERCKARLARDDKLDPLRRLRAHA